MSSLGLSPESSPLKRQRMESNTEEMEVEAQSASTSAGNSSGGGGQKSKGSPLFPIGRPLKTLNKNIHHYTKKFYFKIYANDWIHKAGAILIGFQTVIPWHCLCMYLSPDEYLDIIRISSYAKLKETNFELKLKAVRTPFDANSTDKAQANGNLEFEIKRWDGLEQMLPFQVVDVDPDETSHNYFTKAELIQRLYGISDFYTPAASQLTISKLPATMRERGLSWRPKWDFYATINNGNGPLYTNLLSKISALPIGEFETDSVNTNICKMSEGYCFNKSYKPKNGIIHMSPSAFNRDTKGSTRINIKTRMENTTNNSDNISPIYQALYPQASAPPSGAVTDVTFTTKKYPEPFQPAIYNEYFGETGKYNIVPATGDRTTLFNPALKDLWDLTGSAAQDVVTNITVTKAPTESNPKAAQTSKDNLLFGSNQSMNYYTVADIENYSIFTSRNDPPIHHLPSMLIGAIPKTNIDDSIVNATFEFECTTHCCVEMDVAHPTYYQLANNLLADEGAVNWAGEALPANTNMNNYSDNQIYGSTWMHNETDVALRDPKFWTKSYGYGAKPLFLNYPNIDLL